MPFLKTPDGRRIPVPENATQEQLDSIIANDEAAQGQAAPAPLDAGGLPGVGAPMAAPESTPMSLEQPETEAQMEARVTAEMQKAMLDKMPWHEKALAGSGQAFASMGRGAKQLGTYLRHGSESPEYQRLLEEEANIRKMDEPLLDTGAGRTGQVLTHIGTALVPATGAAKGAAAATKLLNAGKVLNTGKTLQTGKGLAAYLMAEGATGAGIGAAAPVTADESRGANAAWGAGLNIVGGAPVQALKGLSMAVSPTARSAGAALKGVANKLGGESAAAAEKQAARETVGPMIEEITGSFKVSPKAMARAVRPNQHLPPWLNREITSIQALAKLPRTSAIPGAKIQETRETIGKQIDAMRRKIAMGQADQDTAAQLTALERVRRQLDKGVELGAPANKSGPLRELHRHYREGTTPRTRYDDFRAGLLPGILTGIYGSGE